MDQTLAPLAAFGRLAHGFIWLTGAVDLFTALRLLSRPEYASVVPPDQFPVLARQCLSGFDQYCVGLVFRSLAATAVA